MVSGCATLRRPQQPLTSRRWCGFNLLEKFDHRRNAPFVRDDFRMIADWGFSFVRLPMSYWCWSSPDDPFLIDERVIQDVDAAITVGQKLGVHVNLNLHRAPGYCVNPPAESTSLWSDRRAQDAFLFQWNYFANRYRGISSEELSFDLLNEPARVESEAYVSIMRRTIDVIRAADPQRLVVVDGLRFGREPVPELLDTGVWQSTRGYDPMVVSHLEASWINREEWPERLDWPYLEEGIQYDRDWIKAEIISPWLPHVRSGMTVHVGEWGAYNRTPHAVALRWMADYLQIWKEVGWGWALWNLRGSFGILDSGRSDVAYAKLGGHDLDREMLALLQQGRNGREGMG